MPIDWGNDRLVRREFSQTIKKKKKRFPRYVKIVGKKRNVDSNFLRNLVVEWTARLDRVTVCCALVFYLAKPQDGQGAKRCLLCFVEILGPDVLENLDNF